MICFVVDSKNCVVPPLRGFSTFFVFLVFLHCRIRYNVLTTKIAFFFIINGFTIFNRFNYVFNRIFFYTESPMHMKFFLMKEKKEYTNAPEPLF